MNLIKHIWRKILYFLITGSTTGFIAACYGIRLNVEDVGPWIIKTVDSENNPIRGLQVTYIEYLNDNPIPDTIDVATTDSTGSTHTYLQVVGQVTTFRHEAIISDIDGTENGGKFFDTIIAKDEHEETIVKMSHMQ
jgi:hypothetical protein